MKTQRETTSVLEPGTYRLTSDVNNPSPDRRANQFRITSWEAWARWPQDMLFIVEIDQEFGINRVHPQGGLRRLSPHDPGFSALRDNLERVDEQPSDYIVRVGAGLVQHYALGVLDRLGLPVSRVAEIMREMDGEEGQP